MKPQCRSIQRYLSDYIDCTLSGRRTVIVADHLRSCSACRRELESLRRTTGLLSFYIEPEPPDGYYEGFCRDLQRTVEQTTPRPIWRSANWFFRWGRLAPLYTFILIVMSGIFLVTQLFHIPEERGLTGPSQLRGSLRVYPIQLMRAQEDRELVTKRERILDLPEVLSNQLHDGSQKLNLQLDTTELFEQDWGSYSRVSFVSNSELLRGLTDANDIFPNLLASAQLSSLGSVLVTHDFSGPVRINSPFPDKFEREGRRLDAFLGVLKDVMVRDLSLTEVYDSVKL